MADSRLLELEATEAEGEARRQAQRGPSLLRRGLALGGLVVGILVVWEVVKVAFAITDFNLPHIYAIPLAFLKPLAGTGQPMGPLALLDFVGLDVAAAIGAEIGRPVPPRMRALIGEGALGRKSGRGFYAYEAAPA